MFAWFFITTLYLQAVLGFTPFQIGLAFLPANLIMAAFSLGLSAKIVMKFGIRQPLALGLFMGAAGLCVRWRARRCEANVLVDVLPSMVLLGVAAGVAFNPLLLAAMNDVKQDGFGAGLGRRQHGVHDGRLAGACGAREPRGGPHAEPDGVRRAGGRGAEWWVSRGVCRWRGVRGRVGSSRRGVDSREHECAAGEWCC